MYDCGIISIDCELWIFNDLYIRVIVEDIVDKIKGIIGEGYCYLVEK